MKCQKCAKQAVVHLTEIVTYPTQSLHAQSASEKRTVEIHLCLHHAIEAGLIVPSPEVPPNMLPAPPQSAEPAGEDQLPLSIIPVNPGVQNTSLAISRDRAPRADVLACPTCGLNWTQFKHAGLMGCPHDYELFATRLLPLLKRAQEGATDHVGKVPPSRKTPDSERHVATLRLRRELQRAIEAEKYEEAAHLRDQLRHLEQN